MSVYWKKGAFYGMGPNLITTEKIQDVLSVDEFKGNLSSLTEVQWIKLGKSAEYLCMGLAIEGQDILNLAFCKALEGKRKCPRGLPVEIFIYGAIESLVNAYLKKRKRDPLHLTVKVSEEDDSQDIDNLQTTMDTPEEILTAKQTLEEIDQIIKDDEAMVVMAQLDGYSPQQIQETVGLTPSQYASTLRSIRRKLNKLAK
jgi:DNA-directed RNA polymerase specialized sigma24 family protein